MCFQLTNEVSIMSIFSSLAAQISGYASGVKDKAAQVVGDFKKSTENFIGDIVIKSAVERLKEGVLKYTSSNESSSLSSNATTSEDEMGATSKTKKKTQPTDPIFGSAGIMQSLMSSFGVKSDEITNQLESAISNVGKDVSKTVQEAVREKVNSIKPEDVMMGVGSLLNTAMRVEPDSKDTSASFKIDSALQIIGVVLAALGMIMITYNASQAAPKSKEFELNSMDERDAPSLSIH